MLFGILYFIIFYILLLANSYLFNMMIAFDISESISFSVKCKNRNYCILKCRFREIKAQNERQSRDINGENELKSSLRMPSRNEHNELIYHQSQIIKFS